jgi:hypothetical protein
MKTVPTANKDGQVAMKQRMAAFRNYASTSKRGSYGNVMLKLVSFGSKTHFKPSEKCHA